jgi:hypothetical protein
MGKGFWVAAIVCSCAFAADRPVLNGTWQLDLSKSRIADVKCKAETWAITQGDDSIEIAETITDTGGKQRKIDIQCGTEGKECKIKENGQATQVSLYYNESHLVMLEQSHGTDFVTKKRFTTSDDGKTLTVEVTHLAPPGHKDENLTFVKQ